MLLHAGLLMVRAIPDLFNQAAKARHVQIIQYGHILVSNLSGRSYFLASSMNSLYTARAESERERERRQRGRFRPPSRTCAKGSRETCHRGSGQLRETTAV